MSSTIGLIILAAGRQPAWGRRNNSWPIAGKPQSVARRMRLLLPAGP